MPQNSVLNQNIIEEFKNKAPGFELVIKTYLYLVTIMIFRYRLPEKNVNLNKKGYEKNIESFKSLLAYVEEHCSERITVKTAAQLVNLSPYHFCRIFKKITGRTFVEFLNLSRVNKAEELLRNTSVSITEIAEKVGFCNINYFDRIFKQLKRYSPSQCRK